MTNPLHRRQRHNFPSYFIIFIILVGGWNNGSCYALESLDGRFSFSLSTFDESGKLGQVERAMMAASLGPPMIAVILGNHETETNNDTTKNDHANNTTTTSAIVGNRILMACPQVLPSPFFKDDGTARFAMVTPEIAIGHSGIAADGRVLLAAAQRLAVEHAYTYGENSIPIDLFLEELSLLLQEYTMKPGCRPFGATLLVAHVPSAKSTSNLLSCANVNESHTPLHASTPTRQPQLFRIDPSGAVTSYKKQKFAILNGQNIPHLEELESTLQQMTESNVTITTRNATVFRTLAMERQRLARILQEAIEKTTKASSKSKTLSSRLSSSFSFSTTTTTKQEFRKAEEKIDAVPLPTTIVTASLTQKLGLQVERRRLSVSRSFIP